MRRLNITWKKAVLAIAALYALLCLASWIAWSHPDHGHTSRTITIK
jgi:hypothetical protein